MFVKFKSVVYLLLCLTLFAGMVGCVQPAATPDVDATVKAAVAATQMGVPTQTPDINATVNAAVAATNTAHSALQITLSSSVAATISAMPTATPVNMVELSEEELTALIDQAVAEANAATTQANQTTTQATADGMVTAEEAALMEYDYYAAYNAIEDAYALADQYLAVYAELASETVALLSSIEQDLSGMEQNLNAMAATLNEINQAIAQGQQVAQEAVTQLQQQAQQAQVKAQQAKDQATQWAQQTKDSLNQRPQKFLDMKPQEGQVFSDPRDAIIQVRDYLDTVTNALADGKISLPEIDAISQLGANARESLIRTNKPELAKFSESIDRVTTHVSRGELPQARTRTRDVDRNFPKRGAKR